MSTLGVLNIVYLNECINSVGDKTRKFVFLYRSSSQSQDVFEKFCDSFGCCLLDAVGKLVLKALKLNLNLTIQIK